MASSGGSAGASGSSAGTGATAGSAAGTGGSAGMALAPAGLAALPEPQSCATSQTECNGFCLDASTRDGGGCHFLGPANVAHLIQLSGGVLYFEDYTGISKMDPATGATTSLSSDEATELAVVGTTVYYSRVDAPQGVFSVPTAGGAGSTISAAVTPLYLFAAGGGMLLFDDVFTPGKLRVVAPGSPMITDYSYDIRGAYVSDTDVYYTSTDPNLHRVGFSNLSTQVPLGPEPSGMFAVQDSSLYVNGFAGVVRTDLTGGGPQTLWAPGTGSYTGTISNLFVFPGVSTIFFLYKTATFDHLLALDPQSGNVRRLGSFTPSCVGGIAADASNAYVAECAGIVRLAY
jgi:hypothetical protein